MGSSSDRKSSSSGSSRKRKRVVIGAGDSTRDRYSSLEDSFVRKGPRTGSGRRPVPGTLKSAGRRVAGSKAEARDSRLRTQRRRVRLRVALLVGLVAAAIAGAVWLYNSDAFTVRSVDVVGAQRLSTQQVTKLAALPADVTLLRLPVSDVEARLEANPWVSSAEVTRDFPDGVRIRIVERTPAASVIVNPKTRWLVDGQGVWLARQTKTTTAAVTPIRDVEGLDPVAGSKAQSETLLNAISVLSQLEPSFAKQVKAVSAPTIDKTALITKRDVEVFVGTAEDIGRKQQVAAKILAEEAGKVVYINVRTVDRPTWRGLEE